VIARVLRYSYAQAKTRALKGKLLSPEDWHTLLRLRSLEDLVRYLSGTDYAPVLPGLLSGPSGAGYNARCICLALHDALFSDYTRLMKAVPKSGARLLRSLLARYEAENVKTLLRGVWQARPASAIRPLLYRLTALSPLPVEALLQARQITAAVEHLQATIFRVPLLQALAQFKAQGRLFPLEIAADIAAFGHLAAGLKTLRGFDRKGAQALAGEFVDGVNLCWLVRFRQLYRLSPEETINYTLPGGQRLTVRDLGMLARATDLPAFLEALPLPYRMALSPAQHWSQVQPRVQQWLVGELYRAFQQDPFQIGIELSYLLLKEMEVKALECLVSAVDVGESPARLLDLIAMPLKGTVRV
jgi:V/A-type H+/Na+-transporting ATPase subunit C